MKRALVKAALVLTAIAVCLGGASPASADIVWSAEEGWQRSGEQADLAGATDFDKAFSLYMSGRYSKAAKLLKRIVKKGDEALREEASILLAECYLGAKEYSRAFTCYETYIEEYPAARWADRATEGELEAAKAVLAGENVRAIGLKIWSGYGLGEKIVDKITSRRPFSEYAAQAQMTLANSYFRRRLYIESASAYRQYLEFFGNRPEAPEALLGVGKSFMLDARGPRYTPIPYYQALSVFEAILTDYPSGPQAKQAVKLRATVRSNLAEHYYRIGRWYLKMHKPDAAETNFRKVTAEFPDTRWAGLAGVYVAEILGEKRGDDDS